MRAFLLISGFLALAASTIMASPAMAGTASEPACLKGNAEACFYTGAEYAQGSGVPENKQTAVKYFLKACDLGIPDGCSTSGYLISRGEGNLLKDPQVAVGHLERACSMGHNDGCKWMLGMRSSAASPTADLGKAVAVALRGCDAGAAYACRWGSYVAFDGNEGKHPDRINIVTAAKFAEKGCTLNDRGACIIAERIFADPNSALFDAGKSLRYTNINCKADSPASCSNLSAVYFALEEYELGTIAVERACQLGKKDLCAGAGQWRRYLTEKAAYDAQEAKFASRISGLIQANHYGGAVNAALYELGSKKYAEIAALAASKAGRMADIPTQDLYALAMWFPDGPVRAAADREMRARGTGLEGSFGTGTNTAGAADERWKKQYGSSMPRPTSSGPSSSRPPMLSSAQAAAQTRDKYRNAHCTMNNNANRNLCR